MSCSATDQAGNGIHEDGLHAAFACSSRAGKRQTRLPNYLPRLPNQAHVFTKNRASVRRTQTQSRPPFQTEMASASRHDVRGVRRFCRLRFRLGSGLPGEQPFGLSVTGAGFFGGLGGSFQRLLQGRLGSTAQLNRIRGNGLRWGCGRPWAHVCGLSRRLGLGYGGYWITHLEGLLGASFGTGAAADKLGSWLPSRHATVPRIFLHVAEVASDRYVRERSRSRSDIASLKISIGSRPKRLTPGNYSPT